MNEMLEAYVESIQRQGGDISDSAMLLSRLKSGGVQRAGNLFQTLKALMFHPDAELRQIWSGKDDIYLLAGEDNCHVFAGYSADKVMAMLRQQKEPFADDYEDAVREMLRDNRPMMSEGPMIALGFCSPEEGPRVFGALRDQPRDAIAASLAIYIQEFYRACEGQAVGLPDRQAIIAHCPIFEHDCGTPSIGAPMSIDEAISVAATREHAPTIASDGARIIDELGDRTGIIVVEHLSKEKEVFFYDFVSTDGQKFFPHSHAETLALYATDRTRN